MKNRIQRAGVLMWVMAFVPAIALYSQPETSEADSAFESYIDEAWKNMNRAGMPDSMQNRYAEEFYGYYLNNPESETTNSALGQAFMLWGNTGNSVYVDEALEQIDYDSEVWKYIITALGNIYYKDENKTQQEYNDLLHELSKKLMHPVSRSEVLLALVRYYQEKDEGRVVELSRELVELNASEFHVEQGLGYLYEMESLKIGQKAPGFSAETLDGDSISLSNFEGNYTVLEFWSTWCGPCMPEIPHLKALWKDYSDSNFRIVGISLDEDKSDVKTFIDKEEMEWPQIVQAAGFDGALTDTFNVNGIPRMYLLDPNGTIIAKDLRGEEMVSHIDSLMQKDSE